MYNNFNYPGYAATGYQTPQPQFNTYNTQPQAPQPGLKGRPVSSLEEAKVANIDFDGSLFVFPDIVNKKIYTKRINPDGTAAFNIYNLMEEPIEKPPVYATKEELDAAIAELKGMVAKTHQTPQKEAINF